MEQEKKRSNKKILIIVGIIIFIAIITTIIISQLKWKDFKTCKTDKFEIKYNKNWNVTDDLSDFYGKNFEYENNKIEFYLMKKSELPTTRNTATKLKDETLKQLSNSNMEKLSKNALSNYKVKKLETENVKICGLNGYKIEFEISGIGGLTGALLYIEDKNYLYCMSLEGKDIETFNKMIESIKIK